MMIRSLLCFVLMLICTVPLAWSAHAQQLGPFNEVPVPTISDTLDLRRGKYFAGQQVFVRNGQQGIVIELGEISSALDIRINGAAPVPLYRGTGTSRVILPRPLAYPLNEVRAHSIEIIGISGRVYSAEVVVVPPAHLAYVSTETNTPLPPSGTLGTLQHTMLVWPGGPYPMDKPLLVVEGFDASNENSPAAYYGLGFRRGLNDLFPRGQAEGADIVVLNFGDGGRRMQANAAVVRAAITRLLSARTDPRRGLDVVGVSMGGVIARYALAQMEQERQLFGVATFMSIDAPQQGAVIQRQLQDVIREELEPEYWPPGLARPAGRQLLKYNAFNAYGSVTPTDHQLFYAEIQALNGGRGYPTFTTNVGVSLGTPSPNPNPDQRWGRLDLDHLVAAVHMGGWNFDVGTDGTAEPGSYLPRNATRVMGNLRVDVSGTSLPRIYPVAYDFVRYQPVHPTFIPYASALDLTGTVSKFDAPLIALPAGSTPSFHDEVPEVLVGPMLNRLGYELPMPPSVSISGPTALAAGQAGRWVASTPDPMAGYQYNWDYRIILPGSTCNGGGGAVSQSGFPVGEQAPTGIPADDGDDDLILQCVWHQRDGSGAIFPYQTGSSLWLELRVRASGLGGSRVSSVRRVCVGACNGGATLPAPRTAGAGAAGKTSEAGAAVETALVGVWPNPLRAGSAAVVEYALVEAGPVTLTVFDMLGREVARLVDGTVESGSHAASFEASGLPAGAYVVRLEAGKSVHTRLVIYNR